MGEETARSAGVVDGHLPAVMDRVLREPAFDDRAPKCVDVKEIVEKTRSVSGFVEQHIAQQQDAHTNEHARRRRNKACSRRRCLCKQQIHHSCGVRCAQHVPAWARFQLWARSQEKEQDEQAQGNDRVQGKQRRRQT